jgi:hypothetical protein
MAKAYLIRGDRYVRYDVDHDQLDRGYPKALTEGWAGIGPAGFAGGFDSGIDLGAGKLFLFSGAQYIRIDQASNAVDGQPRSIAEAWDGFADAGFADTIQAAVNWGDGKAYFFRGDLYIGYDIGGDRVDEGPAAIAGNWPGMAEAGFGDNLDAAVNWGTGKAYFFKGDAYVRYTIGVGVDDGYPQPIGDGWPGFSAAGFADTIDAAWVKLVAGGGGATPPPVPTPTGALGPGDHVWYYDGQIAQTTDIPRATWFRGSDPKDPTDYKGHGDEIFNYVVHADGRILGGRPQMRHGPGSFAWLNNNPGNITGVPGGPDWGQYPNKFNWHNFLIFPSFQAGFDAIAKLLRGGGYPAKTKGARQWPAGRYRDLGITEAFHRYAPAGDGGNDPDRYGADVAAAAGVSTTTLVGDLDDAQMRKMQDKIFEIEGTHEGLTLSRDHPDLPEAVRAALG